MAEVCRKITHRHYNATLFAAKRKLIMYETQLRLLRDRIAHFTGRHKPVHGGKAYAVLAADTREMSNPAPLLEARLSFIGNQQKKSRENPGEQGADHCFVSSVEAKFLYFRKTMVNK